MLHAGAKSDYQEQVELVTAAQPDDPSRAPGARLRQAVAKQQPDIVPGLDMSDTQELLQHASSMERSHAAQRPLEQAAARHQTHLQAVKEPHKFAGEGADRGKGCVQQCGASQKRKRPADDSAHSGPLNALETGHDPKPNPAPGNADQSDKEQNGKSEEGPKSKRRLVAPVEAAAVQPDLTAARSPSRPDPHERQGYARPTPSSVDAARPLSVQQPVAPTEGPVDSAGGPAPAQQCSTQKVAAAPFGAASLNELQDRDGLAPPKQASHANAEPLWVDAKEAVRARMAKVPGKH